MSSYVELQVKNNDMLLIKFAEEALVHLIYFMTCI